MIRQPEICGIDFRDNGDNRNISDGSYSAELYTQRIEKLVAEHNQEEPLFLYAGLQNVHFPLEAPEEYLSHYSWIKDHDRRVYAAMTMVRFNLVRFLDSTVFDSMKSNLKSLGSLDWENN